MGGRDPDEPHRAATPLELLYDLTFVVAFGLSADELAHYLAEGHIKTALIGFSFATFAIVWAWINFTWFASAYDTDDWIYRLTTMVQMVGVVILAMGLPRTFESLDEGGTMETGVIVAGYVVMRVAMSFQWGRAARQDPARRRVCHIYLRTILVAQLGWIALAIADTSVIETLIGAVVLVLVEVAGPYRAERRGGTPWHPHHIAERYGLLVIIALGEGIIGTIASLSALTRAEGPGWTLDAVLVATAGIALTFGMWWIYFVAPSGPILQVRRDRSFVFGYGHIPIIGAVVATGGGLHVAAYYLEEHSALSAGGTVLAVAIPVAIYILGIFVLYTWLTHALDRFHLVMIAVSTIFIIAPIGLAAAGASMGWCLLVLALAPWVTVVGYELRGHEHNARVLQSLQ